MVLNPNTLGEYPANQGVELTALVGNPFVSFHVFSPFFVLAEAHARR